jgi:hypothetical protein
MPPPPRKSAAGYRFILPATTVRNKGNPSALPALAGCSRSVDQRRFESGHWQNERHLFFLTTQQAADLLEYLASHK